MYKPNFQPRKVIVFHQFKRKGYSLFACLGREVIISVLSVATLSATKAATISDETWRADQTPAMGQHSYSGMRTSGIGTTYSFAVLSQIEGTGVEVVEGQANTYIVTKSDTIDAADSFQLDEAATVMFATDVSLVIQGKADLTITQGKNTTLTRLNDEALPSGIHLDNEEGAQIENVVFNYVGLKSSSQGALNVSNCTFSQHNGTAAAALYILSSGQSCTISNCHFEQCEKAAIGTPANASRPLTISHCTLLNNSTRNGNIPQINITAASVIEIDDCTIQGNPNSLTDNNKVGGIGISNFASFAPTSALISNCTITHNRYGIGTVGPIDNVRIEDNNLLDNNHEANAMQGGSGISLYDPYAKTNAIIAGNRIEGNLWGVTIIGCKDVNLGQPDNEQIDSPGNNTFNNNGCLGEKYDLYNNSTLTVYAQNNTWGVDEQTPDSIESVIFHQTDDDKLGLVIYLTDEQQTAIRKLFQESSTDAIYSLGGNRLKNTPRKGIYIRNGKKVVL